MDQGWKRLPLLVILLSWRHADGFKGGAYSNAHHQWRQPSDTSPHAVQSSMSEARVSGILPVEVGSRLFPNKPLKSGSKFNLLQFVKGGSSSSRSMSYAQTAPSSSVVASLPLPLNERPSSTFSGLTIPGAASGSGHVISTQGESSSYPAELGISGQSTSDRLHVSSSQGTSVHQSAEVSLPVFSQSISHSSSSAPGATSTSHSNPVLLSESLGQPVSSLGSCSGLSQGASSPYTPDSNTKLSSTISSQSTGDQSSPSLFSSSSQGSPGTFLPQAIAGATTVQGSRKQFTSAYQGSSGAQFGASTSFASGVSRRYGGSVWPQDTASPFAPGSQSSYASVSLSSPQAGPSIQGSRKRLISTYVGSSGTQAGSSTPFSLQGSTTYGGSPLPSNTASQFVPGSPSSYPSVLSSPQAGPSIQGSRKRLTSTYVGSSGTQAGSSTRFTLQGSTAYGGSPPPQDTASQFVPGSSSPYAGVSLSSPQGAASQSSHAYQGQSQKSQRWQPSVTRWTQGIQTSDGAASQASSTVQLSALSSAGGSSSGVYGPFVSTLGGSTSNGGSYQSQSLSSKYTPGSQLLPYDPSVGSQGTSSASEVLSSYSSVHNQNAPAQPSRSFSSRFYSVKG